MDDGLGNGDDTTPRELIHFVTQQTRFALINNILQHPEQLPSIYDTISDKPEKMVKYENAPRPEVE